MTLHHAWSACRRIQRGHPTLPFLSASSNIIAWDYTMAVCLPAAGLTEVILTGGLPPRLDAPCAAEEAYRRLYPRIIAQNHKFYKRFPGDVARVQRIVTHLSEQPEGRLCLANGDHLTPRYPVPQSLLTSNYSAHAFDEAHATVLTQCLQHDVTWPAHCTSTGGCNVYSAWSVLFLWFQRFRKPTNH